MLASVGEDGGETGGFGGEALDLLFEFEDFLVAIVDVLDALEELVTQLDEFLDRGLAVLLLQRIEEAETFLDLLEALRVVVDFLGAAVHLVGNVLEVDVVAFETLGYFGYVGIDAAQFVGLLRNAFEHLHHGVAFAIESFVHLTEA